MDFWFFRAGGNQNFVQKHSTSKCKQCSPVFEEANKFCQFQLVPKLLNSSIQVPGVLPLQYFAPFFRATSRPSLAESHGLGDLVGNALLVHGCTICFFVICMVKYRWSIQRGASINSKIRVIASCTSYCFFVGILVSTYYCLLTTVWVTLGSPCLPSRAGIAVRRGTGRDGRW